MSDGTLSGDDIGPKMARCDERERAYVRAMLDYPTALNGRWAKLAGYGGPNATPLSMRQIGHRVRHRQRVIDAVEEETWKRVKLGGAIGLAGLVKIASNPKSKGHQKACESLADRAGFRAEQRIAVDHTHRDLTGAAMAERIAQLAAKHGLDPVKLLGGPALVRQPEAVEAEFTEVKE